ncbi:glycine zipper domain-containing protein [Endozoicomonas sp. SCSIO W0465]|uniref:glycine zipper domain-containing protein n=1 Tax=Endozoicomonas sp. SCSIO W0465 TaxID=2918516 RepID=UPI002075770A|nr:glycine zipper domain-containing protein [Endozoicomonas sp. SCSIO W0465]USE34268.1 glycine zipper domain-containing protein [Endozoicomonas sp. SCSIO W0465]
MKANYQLLKVLTYKNPTRELIHMQPQNDIYFSINIRYQGPNDPSCAYAATGCMTGSMTGCIAGSFAGHSVKGCVTGAIIGSLYGGCFKETRTENPVEEVFFNRTLVIRLPNTQHMHRE